MHDTAIDYPDVQMKLEKADKLENRLPGRAETLREEAADAVGAADHTENDRDTLAKRAEQAQYTADDGDGPDLDTLSPAERVDEAARRAQKTKTFESRGMDDRAGELWTEAEEFVEGVPADALQDAGYDTLAALVDEQDFESQAAEYEDWDTRKSRIDTLKQKIPAIEDRAPSREDCGRP